MKSSNRKKYIHTHRSPIQCPLVIMVNNFGHVQMDGHKKKVTFFPIVGYFFSEHFFSKVVMDGPKIPAKINNESGSHKT